MSSGLLKKLAELSDLYVSASHFGRLCVQHMGASPREIVNQIKMESARELLELLNGQQEHCEMVGYETYFAFSIAFKRRYSQSPREFRKEMSV